MTQTSIDSLVIPGVYQLVQGASIKAEQWSRFTEVLKEAFWLLPAQLRPYKPLGFEMNRASELFDDEGSVTFNHKNSAGYCCNPFYLRQMLSDDFQPYRKVESQRCRQDLFVRIVLVLLHNICPGCYHITSSCPQSWRFAQRWLAWNMDMFTKAPEDIPASFVIPGAVEHLLLVKTSGPGKQVTTEEWEAISGIELWLAQQHND
ncbi:hypothetical protein [Pantoea sp. JK]|uniref:hypothetical protein n=1 Tax=Pantoea sp. JK TaxID=2871703 RepID=UPI002238C3AB|nr:hypothetical protein [Pantoea sp. JK]MCW6034403.1 hypothetical protein [Pantoea sp. JK]